MTESGSKPISCAVGSKGMWPASSFKEGKRTAKLNFKLKIEKTCGQQAGLKEGRCKATLNFKLKIEKSCGQQALKKAGTKQN